ncbi:hypothetical protein AJ80_01988 [Polytolypa hystricis UAMH7299]|uniref:Uncharacterized protein n=1 Tax=Polytolypa hystricis (strain UAMH7299) TaxID=1447883 RepID=A0A2B7YQH7_POLH7|nr:hypothetical protein AJ80_01988 [Polytolypa hystricis UAMH7299]
MTKYTIKIHNKSDHVQNFLLFNSPPTKPTSVGIWSNVWAKSPGVGHPHGNAQFTITSDLYAVCGMTDQSLDHGVNVSTADSHKVDIKASSRNGTKVTVDIKGGGAVFENTISTTSTNGCYAINTTAYHSSDYPNVFVGLGRQKGDDVIPVAVWSADPSEDYEIAPVEKFFVSTGNYREGDAVNVSELGKTVTFDFTGTAHTAATTTFQDDGTYTSPTYSDS